MEQQVVGEVPRGELPQAVDEFLSEQKSWIRLILNDVTHAHKSFPASELPQLLRDSPTPQVDPAHDATDERMPFGQIEQPTGLFVALPGLHRNCAANASRRGHGLEILWQVVACQLLHAGPDPGIRRGRVAPEVLVGVDVHDASRLLGVVRNARVDLALSKTCRHKNQ
jgi:hypothetical protein